MEANMAEEVEENTSGFNLGDVLLAPAYGNLEKPFTGQVEKIYENSLLVEITENAPADQPAVNEMNHRAVEVIKHGPAPEKSVKDEDK